MKGLNLKAHLLFLVILDGLLENIAFLDKIFLSFICTHQGYYLDTQTLWKNKELICENYRNSLTFQKK